jgi:hypothetical protein
LKTPGGGGRGDRLATMKPFPKVLWRREETMLAISNETNFSTPGLLILASMENAAKYDK